MNKFIVITAGLLLLCASCSTYTIKSDNSNNGMITTTPNWYVNYDHTTSGAYQEAASSVSPDLELAVKKSILLAKAKIADRINSEITGQTTINKNEEGSNEKLNLRVNNKDTVTNTINASAIVNYEIVKQEILSTNEKSYRAFVLIKVSRENIEKIISNLKANKSTSLTN